MQSSIRHCHYAPLMRAEVGDACKKVLDDGGEPPEVVCKGDER